MSFSDDVNYDLEFRSTRDDAWYSCGVVLEDGNRLRVKYKDFVQSYNDEVFSVSDFPTGKEIERFLRRFRPESLPIEDNECSRVAEGFMICGAYARDGQLRYFDAIVDAVCYKEHEPTKCLCTYLLFWQHGPDEGNTTATSLDDIYIIQSGSVDPTVVNFAKLMKEKVDSFESILIPKNPLLFRKTSSNETITKSQDSGIGGHSSVGFSAGRERHFPELSDQDRDLGGVKETSNHHFIIVENLEKDLCPLLMMDFIHEQTLITAHTYVFPSLLGDTYAGGAILVNSRTTLKRIHDYINNPNHFIVSSSGRPWVIAEDKLRTGTFNTNLQSFQPKYESYNTKNDLKVVRLGTEEYTVAKRRKELYLELHNHVNGLVQRFAKEERSLQASLCKP
ncbi:hypothetical protein SSX86_024186 [Deinandra increscens subsp. villosa]|uniref:SAWADEE domain-containing protein n=1 Tax=Deinandra increscens subsp. villosa TaxID=3103831 RepID=A0AAP0CMC9_9ASTR